MARKRKRKGRRRQPGQAPRTRPARPAAEAAPPRPSRADARKGPPPAPWGSFPLSEIVVLIGLVLALAGFFVGPPRGPVMLVTGLALGSLAGLELAVREHLAGYRSHTVLLSGVAGVGTLVALLVLTGLNPWVSAALALAVFGAAVWALTNAFRERSGGSLFKIKGG